MRVSVILAVHNERDNLMRTLESLFETTQGLEMEVIVVDDGSKDDPLSVVTRKYPRLKTLSFPERQGPGPAKDYGARESRGDTLVFLDSHTKPERGAVRRLVEQVEELEGQAILVPRMPALDVARWENSRTQVGYGYTIDLKTFASKWVALGDLQPSRQYGTHLYESPALIGCAFAISRRLYEKVWGQDPGMRGWGVEDLDLGLKCWLAGGAVLLDPTVAIGHRFQSEFATYQVFLPQVLANQLRMARKNLTESTWIAWTEMARERFPPKFRKGSGPEAGSCSSSSGPAWRKNGPTCWGTGNGTSSGSPGTSASTGPSLSPFRRRDDHLRIILTHLLKEQKGAILPNRCRPSTAVHGDFPHLPPFSSPSASRPLPISSCSSPPPPPARRPKGRRHLPVPPAMIQRNAIALRSRPCPLVRSITSTGRSFSLPQILSPMASELPGRISGPIPTNLTPEMLMWDRGTTGWSTPGPRWSKQWFRRQRSRFPRSASCGAPPAPCGLKSHLLACGTIRHEVQSDT